MRLQSKVVIVTGSCTGIGKAIVRRCVAEGASVVINGVQQDLAEELSESSAMTRPRRTWKISAMTNASSV